MSAANKASKSGASTARNSSRKSGYTHDDPDQSKRFLKAAREAEADETKEGAQRAFKKVVSQPKKDA